MDTTSRGPRKGQTQIPKTAYEKLTKPARISIRCKHEDLLALQTLATAIRDSQSGTITSAIEFASHNLSRFRRHRHTQIAAYLKAISPPTPRKRATGQQGDFHTLEDTI